jgi:hypothetical protein
VKSQVGFRRYLIRLLRPFVRTWILKKSLLAAHQP